MKLIIAGSRTFTSFHILSEKMDYFLKDVQEPVEIVSGGARGADHLGEKYAHDRGYQLKRFPADWETHGKAAGPLRNEEMARYATHAVVFWDGVSRGTKGMIDLAQSYGLKLRVVRY